MSTSKTTGRGGTIMTCFSKCSSSLMRIALIFGPSHMNNPIYGVLIDSIINSYLIQKTGYRPGYSDDASDHIGLVGSSYCDYFGASHYPGIVDCGLRVVKMGKSSLMYVASLPHLFSNLADLAGWQVRSWHLPTRRRGCQGSWWIHSNVRAMPTSSTKTCR